MWERGPIPVARWVFATIFLMGILWFALVDYDTETQEAALAGEFRYDMFLVFGSPIILYALWPLVHVLWLKFYLRGVSEANVNFQIDQRGYTEFQDGISLTLAWALLSQAVESDWYIWLKFTKLTHHIVLPKRHFSPIECNDLRHLIRAFAPPGARVVLQGSSLETDMPFGLAQ